MSQQHVMDERGTFDTYHLFYVEAILHHSLFPQLHRIKPIFENMTFDDFVGMITRIVNDGDYDLAQQFLYFILLFRDMKHLQEYLNSRELSIGLLEKFFIFTYGYCQLHDHSTSRIIDEILYFLDKDRLLELVQSSQFISRDKLLLFFILSKFDIDMLNRYFASVTNISEFLQYFLKLPDEILRSIIARNYHLFQYIMLIVSEGDADQVVSTEFFSKYRSDIEQFSRLNDVIREIKKKGSYAHDREQSFTGRDMGRLSYLVNMIKEFPDPHKAIEYFDGERIFMDDFEKKIVLAVVTDPLLKNTFDYFEHSLDIGSL